MELTFAPTEQLATLEAQEAAVEDAHGNLMWHYYKFGMALHRLKKDGLWRRFRSTSWERYCADYLKKGKRANIDRIIEAALVVDGMYKEAQAVQAEMTVPDAVTHALALGKLPEEQRLETWLVIQDVSNDMILPGSGVTADAIQSIGEVTQELLQTGAVTQSDGEQVEFKAAIRQAAVQVLADSANGVHRERKARAATHRQGNRVFLINEDIEAPPDGTITLKVPAGARVAVRAWIIEGIHESDSK